MGLTPKTMRGCATADPKAWLNTPQMKTEQIAFGSLAPAQVNQGEKLTRIPKRKEAEQTSNQ